MRGASGIERMVARGPLKQGQTYQAPQAVNAAIRNPGEWQPPASQQNPTARGPHLSARCHSRADGASLHAPAPDGATTSYATATPDTAIAAIAACTGWLAALLTHQEASSRLEACRRPLPLWPRRHRVDLAAASNAPGGFQSSRGMPHRLLLWRHRPCHRHARWLHRRLYLHRHRWLHHQCRRHACRHHRWHHHQCLRHSGRASEAVHRLRFQTMRTARRQPLPGWRRRDCLLRPQRLAHRRRWHPHHSRALAVAVEGGCRGSGGRCGGCGASAELERQSSRLVEAVAMQNTWRSGEGGRMKKGLRGVRDTTNDDEPKMRDEPKMIERILLGMWCVCVCCVRRAACRVWPWALDGLCSCMLWQDRGVSNTVGFGKTTLINPPLLCRRRRASTTPPPQLLSCLRFSLLHTPPSPHNQ